MRLRLMVVAYRLQKTVSELVQTCTAREIGEWLEFFEMQNEPAKKSGPNPRLVRALFEQHNRRVENRGSKTR